ncbi:thiamine pyrophosphate-binding protein [Nonomuraea zeae]|uniref:Thiamine pyrophosphate-binding protein n=1 Tax=Nonomuraea zeae TaxID=1642303 RepID=A0A5S4GNJ5_9ACTN|nr:thiamine pyrophosphate-binding protein [Nonomuraea zeae]TMR27920.1 thiamine pyrophosphate-binding protein [Nonomuraea zeae]
MEGLTAAGQTTGAGQVAAALEVLGVRHVFAIASIHNLPILRELRARGAVEIVGMRHEQAAVHAADGYARVTGSLGVALVSTGPGTANAMGGLYEASFASSRVLLITGQVESAYLGRGRGYIHEAEGQGDMLRAVCRTVSLARRAGDLGAEVLRLARDVLTGRPQPAALEIPIDLQRAPAEEPELAAPRIPRDDVDDKAAGEAARLLAGARRPLVWAGGGVTSAGASAELAALAEAAQAPVVTSREGRGALPEDHPLCLGAFPALEPLRSYVEAADVVLAVGTRFQMYSTDSWRLRLPGDLIHLDVDPSVIGRAYPARLALAGDARRGLAQIARRLDEHAVPDRSGLLAEAQAARAAARERIGAEMGPDHEAICASIRRHLPRNGVVVRDATVPAYVWGDRVLPILAPRTSIRPTAAGIGPGLPLAMGAAVGSGAPVVLIQGDGGFMLSAGELAAAAQIGAQVVVCLFNDRGYGVLREIIRDSYGGYAGAAGDVDLATPDFTALAASFGIAARPVADAETFDAEFAAAVARPGPTLLDIDLTALSPIRR